MAIIDLQIDDLEIELNIPEMLGKILTSKKKEDEETDNGEDDG